MAKVAKAVRRIDAIFNAERAVSGVPAAERHALRQQTVAPLVGELEHGCRPNAANYRATPTWQGFYNMLDALADPEHPNHGEVAEYLDGWDPKEIDELPLRIALGRIANRRNAARTRIAKKACRSERG